MWPCRPGLGLPPRRRRGASRGVAPGPVSSRWLAAVLPRRCQPGTVVFLVATTLLGSSLGDAAAPSREAKVAVAQQPWEEAKRLASEAEAAMIQGNLSVALERYFAACRLRRAPNFAAETPPQHPLLRPADEGFRRAGRLKLRHDAEQLEYLVAAEKLPLKPFDQVAKVYRALLPQLPQRHAAVDVGAGVNKVFDRSFNRALHLTRPGRVADGASALDAAFDAAALERRFRESAMASESKGCEAQNGVAYADGLLSQQTLAQLRRWCLESTMWFGSRAGYVAAFMQEAFNAPLLEQVVEELRAVLPGILGPHRLMNMWAFKYANNASDFPIQGTAPHADVAAVNVNLWLTENDANEDLEGGGLVVYTKQAPRDWGFADYNSLARLPQIRAHLSDSGRVVVPHRQNRVVVFNSNLFHETQMPHFSPGYKNRRINLTFLFGRRCSGSDGTNEGAGASGAAAAASSASAGAGEL